MQKLCESHDTEFLSQQRERKTSVYQNISLPCDSRLLMSIGGTYQYCYNTKLMKKKVDGNERKVEKSWTKSYQYTCLLIGTRIHEREIQ